METFMLEIPIDDPVAMEQFQSLMDHMAEENWKYIKSEARRLGIGEGAASDIVYLRSRSRWTQEKEDYLIRLAKAGKALPFIMEDFEVPTRNTYCMIASLHASRDLERGGNCDCEHCEKVCDCHE